jgi:drug/metabolite transporter (DMT)-like permease
MTRRGWFLLAAMGVLWGVPYLLIKVAVKQMSPPVVVFGRTSVAAVVLIVLAARTDAIRPALRRWKMVLAFAAIEIGGPWLLLTNAEKRLPSGLAGLLVSCMPLVGAVGAYVLGDHTALRPLRLVGIAVGLAGVALLVGSDLSGRGGIPWGSVFQMILVCVCYAAGPLLAARRLSDVPPLGVIAVSLASVAIVYAPFAWFNRPSAVPPARALWAVLALSIACTGIAFFVFFALIAEIGPTRAMSFAFMNPAVAVILGAVFLHEAITLATVGGFILVLTGCWFATRPTSAIGLSREQRGDHRVGDEAAVSFD